MPTRNVQIRRVPDELHRQLKARAAIEGMSMSDFVLREIKKALERPPRAEVLKRLAEQRVRATSVPAADVIREDRDRH